MRPLFCVPNGKKIFGIPFVLTYFYLTFAFRMKTLLFILLSSVTPYLTRVFEYRPAPGQFINTIPTWETGDTAEDMAQKAQDALADNEGGMVSLGSWGGYIVFGFDHEIINVPGAYDLKILGNATYAMSNPNDTTALGGSSEPGVVMVSRDDNGNGLPDDKWYELAGSEESNPLTRFKYKVTYYRPADNAPAEQYILWRDNEGNQGYLPKNAYHTQNYFPEWISDNSMSFTGTRLRDNGKDESGKGSYYVLYSFDWGYADNHPNVVADYPERHASEFDIDWAVNSKRESVHLPGIHFVKVYSGVLQVCGWLGETSTEITNAYDLHPNAQPTDLASPVKSTQPVKIMQDGQLVILRQGVRYNAQGQRL